jgi:tetratricopeptide (TPR) repeat protein
LEIKSDFIEPYVLRGEAYEKKKDYTQAIADYTKAITLKPKQAYLFLKRGNGYFINLQAPKAIADFTKAIEIDPQLVDAYKYRSVAYVMDGKDEAAEADKKKFFELKQKIIHNGIKALEYILSWKMVEENVPRKMAFDIVSKIAEYLDHNNPAVRLRALNDLGKINHPAAAKPLYKAAQDEDPQVSKKAQEIINKHLSEGWPLSKALADKNPQVQKRAREIINKHLREALEGK